MGTEIQQYVSLSVVEQNYGLLLLSYQAYYRSLINCEAITFLSVTNDNWRQA